MKSPKLSLRLLGDFQITYDDQPVTAIGQQRQQALLTWLVIHRDAPQPRPFLAFNLWPDSTEAQALTNLRRRCFNCAGICPTRTHFCASSVNSCNGGPNHPRLWMWPASRTSWLLPTKTSDAAVVCQHLEAAIEHYGGDLLPGCYDNWLLPLREQLHQQHMGALDRLVDLLEERRDYAKATGYAERSLSIDPLHEGGYLRLMRLHALLGNRARGAAGLSHLLDRVDARDGRGAKRRDRSCLRPVALAG
ncbi:MAG: hypothetical protein HC802_16520 [Caldilineaceae bacterium]|nr:hypothetical protein [Caldilineaceae bacterium]